MYTIKIAAIATLFLGLGAALDSPFENYEVVDLVWDTVTPSGEAITVTGTVQDVVAEITKIEPEYNVLANLPAPISVRRRAAEHLERRGDRRCGSPWAYTSASRIQEGINYLRGIGGQPRNGPGPGKCGRVSCSYNAAIYWCNDNNFELVLSGWNKIADSAQYLKDFCTQGPGLVAGQCFENERWNTIIREDRC